MIEQLEQLKNKALSSISAITTSQALGDFETRYLGRKGELAGIVSGLRSLPDEQKPTAGQKVNEVKKIIVDSIQTKKDQLTGEHDFNLSELDQTWPGKMSEQGHLHPLTRFQQKVEDIFRSMSFEIINGQEIETPEYNFDLLNIPKDHPSRDLWDTYYLEQGLLLRTHTSPMQLRAMEKRKPPVRLIVPGRTYRHEATDASHETTFYQVEGLVIDQGISVANLLATIESFFQVLYGSQVKIRANGSYFPFTEPSLEISMSCLICRGSGCSVCGDSGWLEMGGSGMVHPTVLKNMNVDPDVYSGFAFGFGLDRLMMLYYGIDDVRLSYQSDLRFLQQF